MVMWRDPDSGKKRSAHNFPELERPRNKPSHSKWMRHLTRTMSLDVVERCFRRTLRCGTFSSFELGFVFEGRSCQSVTVAGFMGHAKLYVTNKMIKGGLTAFDLRGRSLARSV
jgi:hypothetical protein